MVILRELLASSGVQTSRVALLCGTNGETAKVWQGIAHRSEGKYMAIAQDGGVQIVATPYDDELARLNAELTETVLVYGRAEERKKAHALNRVASAMPASAAADRAAFAAESGRAGTRDLVSAVDEGTVNLETIAVDELPEALRTMSSPERTQYVAERKAKRDEIHRKIREVTARRAEYARREVEKAPRTAEGFDAQVVESLKEQGRNKGLTY
ncbi:MAG: hypothetical protein V2A79_00455 [Planctomycetota bacterium]